MGVNYKAARAAAIATFLLSAACAPASGQAVASFPTVLFQGRSFQEAWGALDAILGPPGRPLADVAAAEAALSVLQTAGMNVTEAEREALILRTLDRLLAGAAGSAAQSASPAGKSGWPGVVMPVPLRRLYDNLSRYRDATLRTKIIEAASRTDGLDVKPLILEAERVIQRFEGLERLKQKAPVPSTSVTEDPLIEEEAAAIVAACRGRVNDALAFALSDIAGLSGESKTVVAARLLARRYWSVKSGAGNSKP